MLTTITMPKAKRTAKKQPAHIATKDNFVKDRLCESFKKLRESLDMTQVEFAEEIGVPIDYIKAVERKLFQPSHQIIYMVAEKYKLSIDNLYGRIHIPK